MDLLTMSAEPLKTSFAQGDNQQARNSKTSASLYRFPTTNKERDNDKPGLGSKQQLDDISADGNRRLSEAPHEYFSLVRKTQNRRSLYEEYAHGTGKASSFEQPQEKTRSTGLRLGLQRFLSLREARSSSSFYPKKAESKHKAQFNADEMAARKKSFRESRHIVPSPPVFEFSPKVQALRIEALLQDSMQSAKAQEIGAYPQYMDSSTPVQIPRPKRESCLQRRPETSMPTLIEEMYMQQSSDETSTSEEGEDQVTFEEPFTGKSVFDWDDEENVKPSPPTSPRRAGEFQREDLEDSLTVDTTGSKRSSIVAKTKSARMSLIRKSSHFDKRKSLRASKAGEKLEIPGSQTATDYADDQVYIISMANRDVNIRSRRRSSNASSRSGVSLSRQSTSSAASRSQRASQQSVKNLFVYLGINGDEEVNGKQRGAPRPPVLRSASSGSTSVKSMAAATKRESKYDHVSRRCTAPGEVSSRASADGRLPNRSHSHRAQEAAAPASLGKRAEQAAEPADGETTISTLQKEASLDANLQNLNCDNKGADEIVETRRDANRSRVPSVYKVVSPKDSPQSIWSQITGNSANTPKLATGELEQPTENAFSTESPHSSTKSEIARQRRQGWIYKSPESRSIELVTACDSPSVGAKGNLDQPAFDFESTQTSNDQCHGLANALGLEVNGPLAREGDTSSSTSRSSTQDVFDTTLATETSSRSSHRKSSSTSRSPSSTTPSEVSPPSTAGLYSSTMQKARDSSRASYNLSGETYAADLYALDAIIREAKPQRIEASPLRKVNVQDWAKNVAPSPPMRPASPPALNGALQQRPRRYLRPQIPVRRSSSDRGVGTTSSRKVNKKSPKLPQKPELPASPAYQSDALPTTRPLRVPTLSSSASTRSPLLEACPLHSSSANEQKPSMDPSSKQLARQAAYARKKQSDPLLHTRLALGGFRAEPSEGFHSDGSGCEPRAMPARGGILKPPRDPHDELVTHLQARAGQSPRSSPYTAPRKLEQLSNALGTSTYRKLAQYKGVTFAPSPKKSPLMIRVPIEASTEQGHLVPRPPRPERRSPVKRDSTASIPSKAHGAALGVRF